jgi:hypothetical protein
MLKDKIKQPKMGKNKNDGTTIVRHYKTTIVGM